MLIKTVQFGDFEAKEEQIVTFPEGLIGFGNINRYIVMEIDEESPFNWLHAVDDAHICFLVIDPLVVDPNYNVSLSKEDLDLIGADSLEGLITIVIVTVPDDPKSMTANMKGPIVINPAARLAKQLALSENSYTTRRTLFSD